MDVTIPPNYTNQVIVIGLMLFVFILLFVYIVWKKYKTDTVTQLFLTCPETYCSVNIYNGEKRCSSDDSPVLYNPEFEVCSQKYFCSNRAVPYAVNGDFSTNDLGVCEPNTLCRCSATATCAIDELVLFTSNNGSIYSEDNEHLVFSQSTFTAAGEPLVIEYDNPNTQFCRLQLNYFDRVTPGTCNFTNNSAITLTEAVTCVRRNPCINGLLAFKPNDPEGFVFNTGNLNAIYTIPLACVSAPITETGTSAQCTQSNQVPVWNKNTAQVFCYNT